MSTIVYKVVATNQSGEERNLPFVYDNLPYAHSSHLVDIMRKLDECSYDLVSITVV